MKIMFFSQFASGHNVEYLHHYYDMAMQMKDYEFVFVVAPLFEEVSCRMDWPKSENITLDYISKESYESYTSQNNVLKRSYLLCTTLKSYIKKHAPQKVFLTVLIPFLPFLPFVVKSDVKISGIIYSIYLRQEVRARKRLFQDKLKYYILSKRCVFEKIFILNDNESAIKICNIYHSNKFVAIPDPYVPLKSSEVDIRKELGIKANQKMFIHIGDLTSRKGTIDILKSIKLLNNEDKELYFFIFAGKVNDDIKGLFYQLYDYLVKNGCHIFVRDEFCSFEFFGSLCQCCDAILIPYHTTSQSSGILGYASQFRKPVIAPNKGLLGYLVKDNQLGIVIEDTTPSSLYLAYDKIVKERYDVSIDYCAKNSIDSFLDVLKSQWLGF